MSTTLNDYARITANDPAVNIIGSYATALDDSTSDYAQWTGALGGSTVSIEFPPFDIPAGATVGILGFDSIEYWFQFLYATPGAGSWQPDIFGAFDGFAVDHEPSYGPIDSTQGVIESDSPHVDSINVDAFRTGLTATLTAAGTGTTDFRVYMVRLWVTFNLPGGTPPLRRYPQAGVSGPNRMTKGRLTRRPGTY